jgi:Protein tyrosine and serine/threonine kinase/Receptor family ligand binding region
MTASEGFVWFLPVYVSMKIKDNNYTYENSTCTQADIRDAMEGHIAFSYRSFGDDTDVIDSNITVAEWKKKYMNATKKTSIHYNDYAGFTYDAVWVYVKALQELVKADNQTENHPYMKKIYSDVTMKKLQTIISEMDFQGVSGRINFNRGSRSVDINILQWQRDDFVLVGSYKPKASNDTNGGELVLNGQLRWARNQKPDDGRISCALESVSDLLHVNCHTLMSALIVIFCVIIVFACSALSFWFWKRKYDQKLVESEKFLGNYRNILHGSELTKWEIPRENVVINRRLGEGAFGTVFGGEALIDNAWQPIAIKTLKPGSNAENRLDFLAESETMKRFEHKNIVKLLAVCLQTEPLYAIMEYMLYGDLKTYLLARRTMVCEKNTEDPISPKNLTLMALDVARGLSYLASLNYVHRDIALRNCMINSSKVVKIGDFGMARPTFESEYYRFARKGMLPVRWMAPESANVSENTKQINAKSCLTRIFFHRTESSLTALTFGLSEFYFTRSSVSAVFLIKD